MSYLVDTNFLLRLAQSNSSFQQPARTAFSKLRSQSQTLIVVPQNMVEFWVVATRPLEVNGLGLSLELATQEILQIKQLFTLLLDPPEILAVWENLVIRHQVKGRQAHDTRLVAAMIVHQIPNLLTFNTADFRRFDQITAIDPREITS